MRRGFAALCASLILCVTVVPLTGAAGVALAAPVGVGLADTPWPMLGHDPRHSGISPYAGPATSLKKWESPAPGGKSSYTSSPPVIGSDGTIYLGVYGGVRAVNRDGTQKWQFAGGSQVFSGTALRSDGTLYAAGTDGLYAISAEGTGTWTFPTAGSIVSGPAIGPDGTVYAGCSDGRLYAVNPDGSRKWEFRTRGPIVSSPAVDESGTVYVGSEDRSLYAINPDGSAKWAFATAGIVGGAPSIGSDGSIRFASGDGHFYVLNSDGTERWEMIGTAGGPFYNYYGAWGPVFSLRTAASSLATQSGDTIYVTNRTKLIALASDGSQKWSFTGNGVNYFYGAWPPLTDPNGVVYAGTSNGRVYAINPDGTEKWHFTPSPGYYYGSMSYPALGSDGTLYAVGGGRLVAFGGSPTSTSIAAGRGRVKLRQRVALSGAVSSGKLGDRFNVEVKTPKRKYWSYTSMRRGSSMTSSGGVRWSYSYKPKVKGTYYFRVVFLGNEVNATSTSRTVKVRVQ